MPAAAAASVAAELLAFYREPVVHRPRYLHGRQPLPEGHVVLRFALGRFPHGWSRGLRPRDREDVRTAAVTFVRQVCLWEHATHYQVLCVPPNAERQVIRENYHLLIALIHPDRQELSAQAWPTGCAQRVNQAYETLSDAGSRAEYDAALQHPPEPGAFDARAREATPRHAGRRRSRPEGGAASLAKRGVIVAGVIATLFVVQSWWVGGLRPEHSLLERAMPSSLRWGAGAFPDSPRFIGGNAPATFDPGERLEPLKEPKRVAALGSWVPGLVETRPPAPAAPVAAPHAPEPHPGASAVSAVSAAPALPAAPTPREPPQPAAEAPAPVREPPQVVAAVTRSVAARQPAPDQPQRLAQAGVVPKSAADVPTRDQVEGVVALLVGFYDSGDTDRLVGLVDVDSLGWWQGYRMRSAYADFFSATRARRLSMERLTWRGNGSLAEARGEATIFADYHDGRPRLERRVPVELDIALRAGAPRIIRLVLHPNG